MAAFAILPAPRACAAADTLQNSGRMTSLECSFVRTQWFNGQRKVTKGQFFFDGQSGNASYDYSGPFHYRFIINDTSVVGIDKKNNRGYALKRSGDRGRYDELYFSLHLLGQFIRGADAACGRTDCVVRGSVDSCVYFETKTDRGSDIIATARETGRPLLIESFDGSGSLFEQSRIGYDNRKGLPSLLVVRKRWGDLVTVDSLILSSVKTNMAVAPERFAVPPACRLCAFHEMRDAGNTK